MTFINVLCQHLDVVEGLLVSLLCLAIIKTTNIQAFTHARFRLESSRMIDS